MAEKKATKTPTRSEQVKKNQDSVEKIQKPATRVVDNVFIAETSEGELRAPLKLKFKVLRAMRDIEKDGGDDIDGFLTMLDMTMNTEALRILDELDIFEEATPIIESFFEEFADMAGASTGE